VKKTTIVQTNIQNICTKNINFVFLEMEHIQGILSVQLQVLSQEDMPAADKKLLPTFSTSRWSGFLYSKKNDISLNLKSC
jgi:hypothetical protein